MIQIQSAWSSHGEAQGGARPLNPSLNHPWDSLKSEEFKVEGVT